jgi:hypothetical protein
VAELLVPRAMFTLLAGHGLAVVAHAPERDSIDLALWGRTDALRPSSLAVLGHALVG